MHPQIQKLKSLKKNKKHIQINNAGLKEIPKELKKFPKLENLDLFSNKFSALPDWFFNLKNLNNLSLRKNNFENIPTIIYNINSLNKLNIANNKLTKVHELDTKSLFGIQIVNLSENKIEKIYDNDIISSNTYDLNLKGNKLESFPKILNKITTLQYLDLSENKIKSFRDDDFESLENLEELDLSYNELEYLPSGIKNLRNLKKLNLSGNKISFLPKEFENLTKLEFLDLSGNPINNVPVEIQAQGTQGIINYYLSLGDNIQLFEAKLLIVGQGNVGKTYLMNRLIHDSTPEVETTEGIDINSWHISTESSEKFRINVWDFGGQEIYHSTHQFFLTKRSLYLLVWEARTDQQLLFFDYWLNVINLLSNNSPIIIVMNKLDERTISIDQRSLEKNFSNIISFHKVSAKTGDNIPILISEISAKIDELPLIGDKLPRVWLDIRNELERIESNYITKKIYLDICNQHGLSNKKGLLLSQYFHDLGVFLHFQDDTSLKNLVFLKPEWATNAVYKILDSRLVIDNLGEFNSSMLDEILHEYDGSEHIYIIGLMKKFELCFEYNKNKYLVPELLSPEKVDINWNSEDNLRFEYDYDFMPAGIIARFIVRTRAMIVDKKFWKHGVLLEKEDTKALIESDSFARTIRIWIKGNNAPFLLEVIRNEINAINQSLNAIDIPEKIPCNCSECKNSENPYFHNFKFIKKLYHKKTKQTQCQISAENVNVSTLLKIYNIETIGNTVKEKYSLDKILHDLIACSSTILERKNQKRIEDLINDDFTDLLRAKNHYVSDQTRSGKSGTGKSTGEVDIMIRRDNGMPVTIIEAFRLASCGSGNTEVSSHIYKLLSKYDTQGLKRNFILVYSEAQNFGKLWTNYVAYLEELEHKPDYDNQEFPLTSVKIKSELSKASNIKIVTTTHLHDGEEREIYHLVLNMKLND